MERRDASPRSGLFITLEGIEGAGKSTQVELLVHALERTGRTVTATREPGGGGRVGETLRRLLKDPSVWRELRLSEVFLYAAARAHHLETVIEPALEAGHVVVCDRYLDSTIAYQGYGRGRPIELIESLHRHPPLDRVPDRTLLLDLPVADALSRARARHADGEPGYDDEDVQFFERVRSGYLARARAAPERIRIIDANSDVAAVRLRILREVRRLLPELPNHEPGA